MNKTVMATILAILTVVGAVMTLNSGNVSQSEFGAYKEGRDKQDVMLEKRLDKMEAKIDIIIEKMK